LPILFANNFYVLFCTFCLVKLVYFASKVAVSLGCKQSTPTLINQNTLLQYIGKSKR